MEKAMSISIQELAGKIGMSASAISRALSTDPEKRALVNCEKRHFIEEAARRYNYMPNPVAGNLRQQRSGQIGIAMNMNSAIGDLNFIIMKSFLDAARDYQVATWFQGLAAENYKDVLEICRRQRLDAIIVSHRQEPEYLELLLRCRDNGGRVLILDNRDHQWPFPRVAANHFRAGYLAGEYLIRRGCRRCGYYGQFQGDGCSEERFAGFEQALRDHGAPFDPSRRIEDHSDMEECRLPSWETPPDGFFAWNDIAALKLLRRLHAEGTVIPVIGCDNRPLKQYMEFSFPSIDCHYEKTGPCALEMLFGKSKRKTCLIEPELKDI